MRVGGGIFLCGDEVNVFIRDSFSSGRSLTCSYPALLESRITSEECDLKYVECVEDARKYWEKEYRDRISEFTKEQARYEDWLHRKCHTDVGVKVREIRRNKIEDAARELLSIKMGWEN